MSHAQGLLCAAGAAVAFGLQYVPVKKYPIYDGATFQWFMCNGILLVGFLVGLMSGQLDQGLPLPIIFGGVLWGLSNYGVLPLVKLLGIGPGFSMYHGVNLMVGYATGRFGLFGVRRMQPAMAGGLAVCDGGLVLVILSLVIMLGVEQEAEREECDVERSVEDEEIDYASPARELQRPLLADTQPKMSVWGRRLVGLALALVAGGLCGLQSVPATLYTEAHPDMPAAAAVFPQCLGIWVASSCIYLAFAAAQKVRGGKVPHSVIRPPYLSGALWACGFALMIGGIKDLGYSVGYTMDAVGPIAVSSVLSLAVYREVQGRRQVLLYMVSLAFQFLGVAMIGIFGAV